MDADCVWDPKICCQQMDGEWRSIPKSVQQIKSYLQSHHMCWGWNRLNRWHAMWAENDGQPNFLPQYQEAYQGNTSDKSSCGSVFRVHEGAHGKSECSTGCVPLTLAVHLWCNIYCSCGQCQIWMQADHDYRRQLAVSIIHASVGHQWNLSVCNLIQFKFYIMCVISLIVCCFVFFFLLCLNTDQKMMQRSAKHFRPLIWLKV